MQSRLPIAACLIALISLFVGGPVMADDLEEGKAYYKKHDYQAAYTRLEKAAKSGNAEAQYLVGYMNAAGEGTQQNPKKAAQWYQKSAEQGYTDAQLNLGVMYREGKGIKKDPVKAAKWYQAAADKNDADAQFNLARMYQTGEGVSKDEKKAFDLFNKSAEQGNARAMYGVGHAYITGKGATRDEKTGMGWYRKAAEKGDLQAMGNVCTYEFHMKNWDDAFNWCNKADAAGSDNKNISYSLGTIYLRGLGKQEIDNAKAFTYLSKSSAIGNPYADFQLGQMYEYGLHVREDRNKAIEYYRKADAGGVKGAQGKLIKLK